MLLLAALLAAGDVLPARTGRAIAAAACPSSAHSDRVLVVAPHPDDESLCCAGLLQQALEHGAGIGVVWITAGDGFELDAMLVEHTLWPGGLAMRRLGAQRLDEARAAADALGVPHASQYQLGYPDGGVLALTGDYYSRPYRSKYTPGQLGAAMPMS